MNRAFLYTAQRTAYSGMILQAMVKSTIRLRLAPGSYSPTDQESGSRTFWRRLLARTLMATDSLFSSPMLESREFMFRVALISPVCFPFPTLPSIIAQGFNLP